MNVETITEGRSIHSIKKSPAEQSFIRVAAKVRFRPTDEAASRHWRIWLMA
jgi:hypothetical protein